LAGPGEGWKFDQDGNAVGVTTGLPAVRLDDLLVALRTVEAARTEGISVSIDPTADGRPATRHAAVARLARVICADETEFDQQDARELAAAAADAQAEQLAAAFCTVLGRWGFSRGPVSPRLESRLGEPQPRGPVSPRLEQRLGEPQPRGPAECLSLILSGHGDCLARRVLARVAYAGNIVPLAARLGSEASRAATAYALAVLQREEFER